MDNGSRIESTEFVGGGGCSTNWKNCGSMKDDYKIGESIGGKEKSNEVRGNLKIDENFLAVPKTRNDESLKYREDSKPRKSIVKVIGSVDEGESHVDGNSRIICSTSNDQEDDGSNEVLLERKLPKTSSQNIKRRKPHRRSTKCRLTYRTTKRMGTRRNPHPCSNRLEEECPMVKWPWTNRMERPEYPACILGSDEEDRYHGISQSPAELRYCTSEESLADDDQLARRSESEGLEHLLVPGTFESVLNYCRTSPNLPVSLRPEPETLRDLLHDSCVLQCALRGLSPHTMASYIESKAAEAWPKRLKDLTDEHIFIGM